jgi:hypothetical protein
MSADQSGSARNFMHRSRLAHLSLQVHSAQRLHTRCSTSASSGYFDVATPAQHQTGDQQQAESTARNAPSDASTSKNPLTISAGDAEKAQDDLPPWKWWAGLVIYAVTNVMFLKVRSNSTKTVQLVNCTLRVPTCLYNARWSCWRSRIASETHTTQSAS